MYTKEDLRLADRLGEVGFFDLAQAVVSGRYRDRQELINELMQRPAAQSMELCKELRLELKNKSNKERTLWNATP